MCAVRLDRERLQQLTAALLAEQRVLLPAPSARAGEMLTWRSLPRLVLRKRAGVAGGDDERALELQARAVAALTDFYFGEHRAVADLVAETQPAWAAAQATKDLVPVFRKRREICASARQRYREPWDGWAGAQTLVTA